MHTLSRWLPFLALLGCQASSSFEDTDGRGAAFDTGFDQSPEPGPGGDGNIDDEPSEDESDRLLLAPAQTDVFIFIANPDRDTVTRVNVRTQEVRTTRVGKGPRVVQITRDYRTAVVFNQLDDSVSILDAETLEQVQVGVRDNLNQLVLSPDGRWAVVWHAVSAERPDDPPRGPASSYNEVSLVDVQTGTHFPLVVGFNPKDVTFTPDGSVALVIADASMAVLRLTNAAPEPEYVQIADPLSPPRAEEVVVVPDGSYAFVRQFGTSQLTLVDLVTRQVDRISVGNNPTDLDLTPDGLGAVVVSRGALEVSVFDTTDPFAPPRVVPFPDATPFGQVLLGDDDTAILYTTASNTGRYATWDLTTDTIVLRPLAKPASAVLRTPTGTSLLVVHPEADNADDSTPVPYRDRPGVSLIDLGDFRANTISLQKPASGFVNSNDGRKGYLIMEDLPYLEVLDYGTLVYDEVPLLSAPVFVGVLPDLDVSDGDEPPAWVSQQHPLGRISFYDPDAAELETITGFELNGEIEE